MQKAVIYEILNKVINLCEAGKGYLDGFSEETAYQNKSKNEIVVSQPNKSNVIKELNSYDVGNFQGEEMPIKLKYGQGSIVKRTMHNLKSDYVYYQGCIQFNNEKHYITTKTQKECFEKLKELRNELQNKIKKPKVKILTFGDWLQKWYKEYKVNVLKPQSLKNISVVMDRHITNEIKNKPLSKLKSIDLQECLNSIESSRQKTETLKVIRNSLKYAKINGLIKDEIWQGVIMKKHVYKRSKALSKEQQKILIESAPTDLKICIIGYLWTGCRRNELLTIKKEDCNLKEMTITVKGTKTQTSYRVIPLFKQLLEIVQDTKENEFVFKCTCINKKYKELCDKLQFVDIDIHSLRHTFATNCLENGVNIKTIQHWLGHSKMSTTTDIYAHLSNEQEQADITKMEK